MLLPQAPNQCHILALLVLVLVWNLNASAADASTKNPTSYHQTTERLIFYPPNLGFGSVDAGTQKVQTVTITNAGNSEITLLQATGQGSDFTFDGLAFPLTLAGGESFTFTVAFAPRAAGASSGAISFTSARSGLLNRISMSGSAVAATRHKVDLSWHASKSKGVIGYNIYRAQKLSGPYAKLNSKLDGSTVYIDTSVANGTTYYYATTAVNSKNQQSRYSNKAMAKIP